jgi:hypothetical protein
VNRAALPLAALILGIALVVGAPTAAPARVRATHVAGVTVSFGSGQVVHRTVTFSGDSITGLEALRGAGFDVEAYGYSGIGAAVCRIDGVGRPADASCLNGGDQYWAYWRNGRYSAVGAGATSVHDRDQEQWAWGSGDHAPPTTAFAAPTTTRPVTTTTAPVAPPPPAGGGVTAPPGADRATTASTTTAAGSSTTAGRGSTTTSSATRADRGSTSASKQDDAAEREVASAPLSHTSGSGTDGGGGGAGGGGPLALAGFGVVLAAVLALTLRARSARGNEPSRN